MHGKSVLISNMTEAKTYYMVYTHKVMYALAEA
jgi:hypothetical protein